MPFFCDLAPLSPANPVEATFFFYFIGSVMLMLSVIALMLHLFRRKPPIEAEFATKLELNREIEKVNTSLVHMDKRNEQLFREIFVRMDALNKSVDQGFREIHRSLGRLEGNEK
jgi:hypothetical protein